MDQIIIKGTGSYKQLEEILHSVGAKKLLLVCGRSFENTEVFRTVCALPGVETVRFSGFSPNPKYEDICRGVELFKNAGCDRLHFSGVTGHLILVASVNGDEQ